MYRDKNNLLQAPVLKDNDLLGGDILEVMYLKDT